MLEPCDSRTETIRLTHSPSDTIGRLEVCSGDKWGTVCGIGATIDTIATVACRELNHAANGRYYFGVCVIKLMKWHITFRNRI